MPRCRRTSSARSYANLNQADQWSTRPGEVRRQYYNTWHTAQAGVALLDYLDWEEDPATQRAVELAWEFIDPPAGQGIPRPAPQHAGWPGASSQSR